MADLEQGSASHQHEAAAVIQKHFRRYQAQKRYKQQQSAASTIQQHASRFLARRQVGYAYEWAGNQPHQSCQSAGSGPLVCISMRPYSSKARIDIC